MLGFLHEFLRARRHLCQCNGADGARESRWWSNRTVAHGGSIGRIDGGRGVRSAVLCVLCVRAMRTRTRRCTAAIAPS